MADAVAGLLGFAARYARWILVLGLLTGLLFNDLSVAFKPAIPWFIVLLLFAASFRIGPTRALGALSELSRHVFITVVLQVVVPLFIVLIALIAGWHGIFVAAALLVASGAPISGSPNLVMMLGHDPAPALRQLVIGTALLPLTVIPVFFWMPEFGDSKDVAIAVLRLLAVILVASAAGFVLRALYFPDLSDRAVSNIDGLSAILMALVVVGLMWALGDAMEHQPRLLITTLVFAFAVNLFLQLTGYMFWKKTLGERFSVSMGVISGNRNVALFLTALPATVIEDLYLFIGCYQFPMYLTPLLLRRFYR